MSKTKPCFYQFNYYNKKLQKKISPDTTISELKDWLKGIGLNERCTFFLDDIQLGDENYTINDILDGEFDQIKKVKISIRDLELERKKEEKEKEKNRIEEEKKKIEEEKLLEKKKREMEKKERNFQRDLIGTYIIEKNGDMVIQKYPETPFNSNEEQICKTFMVIGQTGSGKTTFLNSIINYILDVKLTDKRRFKIIEENVSSYVQSVTSITSVHYIKSHNNFPYIKIVDTPGLGDTQGMTRDLEITAQLTKLIFEDIEQLDAICFVIKSSDIRLTTIQKYIFNSIIDLFDKDMSKKFFIMLTFSDAKTKKILFSIEKENSGFQNIIPYLEKPYYLEFNCSSIFDQDPKNIFKEKFWNMTMESISKFISRLSIAKPQSLKQTRLLLKNKQRRDILIKSCIYFQNIIEDLKTKEDEVMKKIENIKKTIEMTKDFNIEDKYTVITKENLPIGVSTCTCNICKITCHENCKYPDDSKKRNCEIYDSNGNCTICPKKCPWDQHFNPIGFKLVAKKVTESSNNQELEKLYNESILNEKKMNIELNDLNDQISDYENKIESFKGQIFGVNEVINKHRINPKTHECFQEYIKERIKTTKNEKKDGWAEYLKKLTMYEKFYKFIEKIEDENNNDNYSSKIDNFIYEPFVKEEDENAQTFVFFGDNQIEKNQNIILFIENFIDLTDDEKIYEFHCKEENINDYYIRAYKPFSYIKIIDCPVFSGKRDNVNLMEKIVKKFKENISTIDGIFLLFKDDEDLKELSYVNYFSMISKELKDRFYIIFYDKNTISYGNFNFLSFEDDDNNNNNILNNIFQNQNNFKSKYVFQNVKGFFEKKNYSFLLKKINQISEKKKSIDSKKFINSLQLQISLRKNFFSENALNSFRDLKKVIQDIIKENNTESNTKILDNLINKIDIIIFDKILEILKIIKNQSLFEMLFELPMFLKILNDIETYTNDSDSEENIQYLQLMKFLLTKVQNNSLFNHHLSNQLVDLFQNYIFD